MARPEKKGLDYYPLDVKILKEPRMHSLIKKHGAEIAVVFLHVMNEAYENEGYYVEYDDDFFDLATDILVMTEDKIKHYIDLLVGKGFLQIVCGVLTSPGIQKQYVETRTKLKRKGEFFPNENIWLLNQEMVNSVDNSNNGELLSSNCMPKPPAGTQKKRKEKKEKENKQNNTKPQETDGGQGGQSGEFQLGDLEVFIPQYSELAERINKRLGKLIPLGPRELRWSANVAGYYEEPYIFAAIDKGEKVLREGKLRGQFLKYVDKILQNWDDGIGAPDFVIEEEKRLAAQKAEYMKPSRFKEVFVDG